MEIFCSGEDWGFGAGVVVVAFLVVSDFFLRLRTFENLAQSGKEFKWRIGNRYMSLQFSLILV